MAAPALGWVQIRSTDPPVTLLARLSGDRPNVDAGYGGWQEVARPRRRPLSIWQGAPALRVSLPILFDAFRTQTSVERQIAQLERLATATASDGQPPRIRFVTKGAAVPHQRTQWVIDTLTWGDAEMNFRGNRTRQQVTLSLLEWIADVRVRENSPAKLQRAKQARAKTKQGAANKRVVVKQGETLSGIAARELGDATRWVELGKLNNLRDPHSIKRGQVIRLP